MSDDPINTLPDDGSDEVWFSVIQRMDEAYADLVRSQVEIEEKNAALEQAQSFLDSVQSAMSDLLIVCDQQGQVIQLNSAAEQRIGRSSDELAGTRLIDLISDSCQERIRTALQQIRHQPLRDVELKLKTPTGPVPLAINCSARKDQRGRLVGMVVVGRPLGDLQRAYKALNEAHAELKQAQEWLVQSEKMASLGRLVAGVAHELNNPISFVYGNMHALKRYTDKLAHYFDAIHSGASRAQLQQLRAELRLDRAMADLSSLVDGTLEGADRVREIVSDLRQFSSCQSAEKADFDLAQLVRSVLHWVLKESPRTIEVHDQMPSTLIARGHAGQIHQVVVNLIQNAVDAMASTPLPRLWLYAGDNGTRSWFELHDNGPGLAPDDHGRILDPFFTTKPVGQGSGLGLSISYGILSEHGGELKVENRIEGGAKASFDLPHSKEVES